MNRAKRMVQYCSLTVSGAMLLLTAGCHGPPMSRPLVVDRAYPATVTYGTHTVQSGESLYLIAWRYHRDFRELATINRIKPPYIIYQGQVLALSKDSLKLVKQEVKNQKKAVKTKSHVQYLAHLVKSSPPTSMQWIWPAHGAVVGKFSNEIKEKSGIDISALEGSPICAAAAGKVVYSGSGLRGLGRLIIIKHNDQYLSAYAHNSRLIVKEGDIVKVGQKIAEMGRSDTNQVKLHFEIRKNGVPVDPLMYLAINK